jgi:hypothetical protein
MVSDPPDYYFATGQNAIVLPDQGMAVILQAADRYGASYLLLEPLHSQAQDALWSGAERSPRLRLLWSTPTAHLYRIIASQRGSFPSSSARQETEGAEPASAPEARLAMPPLNERRNTA